MVFQNRLTAVLLLSTSSLLAACAAPSDSVITRASQVNAALSNVDNECQYSGISNSLSEQIMSRDDADDVLRRLSDVCSDLEFGFSEGDGSGGSFRTVAIGDSFSDPDGSPTKGGNEGSGAGAGTGSGSGGNDGGGSGTQSSGGGGTGGDGSGGNNSGEGSSGGSNDDGGGSQGLGDAQGGIGGGGNEGSGGGSGQTE